MIGLAAGGVALGLGAALLATNGDDGPTVSPEAASRQLATELRERGYATADAQCISGHVADSLPSSNLGELGFGDEQLPDSLPPAVVRALGESALECRAKLPSDRSSPANPATEESQGSATTAPPQGTNDFFADIFAENLGLTSEQAECLAGVMMDQARTDPSGENGDADISDAAFRSAIEKCHLPDAVVQELAGS